MPSLICCHLDRAVEVAVCTVFHQHASQGNEVGMHTSVVRHDEDVVDVGALE